MIAIGFRVEPTGMHWAMVETTTGNAVLIDSDFAKAPKMYNEAASLSWYRQRVTSLVDQYHPKRAAVRYPETFGKSGNKASGHRRCRIEGVILDALNASGIEPFTGPLSSISSRLGSKNAKHYLEQNDIRGLDFGTKSKELREAILVAVSALEDDHGHQDGVDIHAKKTNRSGSGPELDGLLG